MGLFLKAMKVSSGATLGYAATNMGIKKAAEWSETSKIENYNRHRKKFYDPFIRKDLIHLEVDGKLQAIPYPFYQEKKITVDYKHFDKQQALLLTKKYPLMVYLCFVLLLSFIGQFNYTASEFASGAWFIFWIILIIIACQKLLSNQDQVTKTLMTDGKQYWHIREYVRQALDENELTPEEGIKKLLNARLVQQFPDTIEEIEANAFYYKKEKEKGLSKEQ